MWVGETGKRVKFSAVKMMKEVSAPQNTGESPAKMSHSAWVETGRMDDMVGWCLPG